MTKRLIAAFLVVLCAVPSFADSIAFELEDARRLMVEVQTCRVTSERLSLCDEEVRILMQETAEWKRKSDALVADKSALKNSNAALEEMAVKSGREAVACEESKPSRWTWFSLGAIAGILAVVGASLSTR